MKIEQFVMAYGVEQDRLRALLPDGFISLRPVLRINAEIRDDRIGYVEFNTAVERDDFKGWLNIAAWDNIPFSKEDKTVRFHNDVLDISFTRVGVEGSCPAEKDNAGCYFISDEITLVKPEQITVNKEFCDCTFAWLIGENGAHGVSIGKTLPAIPTEAKISYPKVAFTFENAASIPCDQVLGTYADIFQRG